MYFLKNVSSHVEISSFLGHVFVYERHDRSKNICEYLYFVERSTIEESCSKDIFYNCMLDIYIYVFKQHSFQHMLMKKISILEVYIYICIYIAGEVTDITANID